MERATVTIHQDFHSFTIIHISDTHNKDYDDKIPPGDILIHSGDFTHRGKEEEIQKFALFLSRQPHRFKIVVCGNHEYGLDQPANFSRLKTLLGENVIILQDEAITIHGIKFWGTAWNNSSQAWGVNSQIREEKWKLIPSDTDVLITHIPPYGILDLAWQPSQTSDEQCPQCNKSHPRYNHWGDQSLAKYVNDHKIPLHLFGHVHDEVGIVKIRETTYSNAAMDISKIVNVIKVVSCPPPIPQVSLDWPMTKILHRLETLFSLPPPPSSPTPTTATEGTRRPRAVLLATGAFNPIHKGHLQNMELAKSFLDSHGFDVLGGFLSPSSDIYVSNKMRSLHDKLKRENRNNSNLIPSLDTFSSSAAHRLQMIRLACDESDWMSESSWESNQDYFADFAEVLINLEIFLWDQNIFNHPEDKVIYVCGSDHFLKCHLRKGVGTMRGSRSVIVCTRQEEREDLLRSGFNPSYVTILSSSTMGEGAEALNDLSSTLIRSHLYNLTPESTTSLRALLPDPVSGYLLLGEGRGLYREREREKKESAVISTIRSFFS